MEPPLTLLWYIYGSYVAGFKDIEVHLGIPQRLRSGAGYLFNTLGGGLPSTNIPNISQSTDNRINHFELFFNANRYRFEVSNVPASDPSPALTVFNWDANNGTQMLNALSDDGFNAKPTLIHGLNFLNTEHSAFGITIDPAG